MKRILIPLAMSRADFPEPAPGADVVTLSGDTMGTTWSVNVVLSPADAAPAARDDLWLAIQRTLDDVVHQMSTWEPESDLSRFNGAPAGTWQTLPDAFYTVLDYALTVARQSQGAFDPTVGPLVDLWGFGPTGKVTRRPADAAIQGARVKQGWSAIRLDPAGRRACQPGGARVDLSAVAKGFGVDQVALLLRGLGHAHALVEVGGELRGAGAKPDGEPWWVALEQPAEQAAVSVDVSSEMLGNTAMDVSGDISNAASRDPAGAASAKGLPSTIVALHGLAIATSGDYRRFFEQDGERFSHTLDPRTGYPVPSRVASVTVLHPECMVADALATALTVMGETDGPAWAQRNGVAARFVMREDDGYSEVLSPGYLAMAS
jgi:thiamine biosynthesis lipoprotein